MGCELLYTARKLAQLRTGKHGICHLYYVQDSEKDRTPISIRLARGPNKWKNTYLYPPNGSFELVTNSYYWIEGADVRYLFVDSVGDAWFFERRIAFEMAIGSHFRLGPAFHLQESTHYSQLELPNKVSPILSRYARILKRTKETLVEDQAESEGAPASYDPLQESEGAPASYDPLQDILDFEFNKPKPAPLANRYALDFEALAREAIEEK